MAKIKNITVENCGVPDALNLRNSGSSKQFCFADCVTVCRLYDYSILHCQKTLCTFKD